MQRRGQAAMEFLMTYGWAILAAVIAIGVLAYFGVFSPGRFVSSNFVVNAPFNVRAGSATVADGIQLELLNGAGESVTLAEIDVSNCGTINPNTVHATGNVSLYSVACTPALVSGDTFRGDITITYTKSGTSLNLTSTGTITTQVS